MMKIILLGPPGAGKGTQAEVLSKHFGIPTISTGAIIREEIKSGSPLGKEAETYIKEGRLAWYIDVSVPRVKGRLQNGFMTEYRTIAGGRAIKNDL